MENNNTVTIKKNRRTRRAEEKYQRRVTTSKYTTSISDHDFRMLATKAVKGELSSDEWSRCTPALKKKLIRFNTKIKRNLKDPNFLKQLPADAIIKDVNLNPVEEVDAVVEKTDEKAE